MFQKIMRLVLFGFTLASVLAACNLPMYQSSTQIVFPTPNLTMTAIFNSPTEITKPSTPQLVQPSLTELPTVTQALEESPTPIPPTATLPPIVPTPTPVNPPETPARPGWIASYLATAPTIDGPWGEWNTSQFPMRDVVWGSKNWTGSADLDGAFRVGWDANYLYLAVKVTDDHYVQNASGKDLYKGDSLEVLVDANLQDDATNTSLSSDDYQIGISPGKGGIGQNMEAYRWFPSAKEGSLTNVKIGAVAMSDGYRLEAAVPWSVLGVTPSDGLQLGFGISVSDNDSTDSNAQQSMVSSIPSRSLVDPTTWGVLTLRK